MISVFAFTEDDGFALAQEQPTLAAGAEDDDGDEGEEGDGDDDIDAGIEERGLGGLESGASEAGGDEGLLLFDFREETGSSGGEEFEVASGEGDDGKE